MSFLKSITTKPWERKGVLGGLEPEGAFESANEKVALSIFLIVASVVFSLFTVGYILRMELPDWRPLSEPNQLWFNTGLLIASSLLFQWAKNITQKADDKNLKLAFFWWRGARHFVHSRATDDLGKFTKRRLFSNIQPGKRFLLFNDWPSCCASFRRPVGME
jgi:hypothetical protein